MSYNPDYLRVLASNGGFTIWIYHSDDTQSVVSAPNYFKDAMHLLKNGDAIYVRTPVVTSHNEVFNTGEYISIDSFNPE